MELSKRNTHLRIEQMCMNWNCFLTFYTSPQGYCNYPWRTPRLTKTNSYVLVFIKGSKKWFVVSYHAKPTAPQIQLCLLKYMNCRHAAPWHTLHSDFCGPFPTGELWLLLTLTSTFQKSKFSIQRLQDQLYPNYKIYSWNTNSNNCPPFDNSSWMRII